MQFSLRTLLAAVAAIGIGAALWVAEPSWQVGAVEFFLAPCVLGSATLLALHSSGRPNEFWTGVAAEIVWPILVYLPVALLFSLPHRAIGAVDTAALSFLHLPNWFPHFLVGMSETFRPVLLAWAFAPIVGLLCVLMHWVLLRPPEPKD